MTNNSAANVDVQSTLDGVEEVKAADNQWFGDMMILQVLADSDNVNEQEREVLTRWMAASDRPSVAAAGVAAAQPIPRELAQAIDTALDLHPISIRLPKALIERYKEVAAERGLIYQPLMRQALAEWIASGVPAVQPWEVKVHCSKGERTLRAGMQWRDGLHGSIWVVVEPEGGRIYSPSGLGGTPTFWCLPASVLPEAAKHLLEGARADGCVSFCGDSIAAGLVDAVGVKGGS